MTYDRYPADLRQRVTLSRRLFCIAVMLSALLGISSTVQTLKAASPPGDVVGKVTVGYQGWFSCAGDGAPIGGWWHYSGGAYPTPNTLSNGIHCWPDVRQFENVYQTGFTNFGNGQPATLFSSYDQQTVNTHFRWMAENGINTAALQRFNPFSGEGLTRDAMAVKVKIAAESYGRKFYIMYDATGWLNVDTEIKTDWTNKMAALTASPAYARQSGKPVVCIWGLGMNDQNHPFTPDVCLDIVNWFKSQGCYVIGGTRRDWRTVDPTYLPFYNALNMISPWMIGYIGSVSGADGAYANFWVPDQAYCNANGIDYQPCVLPGDVLAAGQRVHGNLEWEMFYNATRLACQGIYISMFDEFNEGNQIACTAENASMSPSGYSSLYPTLDQDGTACSSDYYLRLTGDGNRMFKGITSLTSVRPTVPVLPVVYPAAPLNLIGKSRNGQAVLSWNAVTGPADVLSYNVKRATVSGGPYTAVATNVGNVSYVDSGLSNGATYYYVVSAVNSLGESADSIQASVTPTAFYKINSGSGAAGSFTADTNYSGGNSGGTGTAIDTSAVTNPAPQAVYQTERWGNNIYTFSGLLPGTNYKVRLHFAEIFYTAAGIRQFNVFINGIEVLANYDIFAAAGTNYKAVIKGYTIPANGSGQIIIQYVSIAGKDNAKSSGIEVLPIDTALPPVPSGLGATTVSSSQIMLSWTTSATADSYKLKRATSSGGPYTTIATNITGSAYWDSELAANTTYYYEVSAVNGNGEGGNSVAAGAATQALPVPAPPVGLNIVSSSNGQVVLTWNGCGWADGYNVKQATNSGGPYTIIGANVPGVLFTNSNLAIGATYYFVVSSTNTAGESANSSEASVTLGKLNRAGWGAAASSSNVIDPPTNAIDGDIGTRWSTGAVQTPGQWFQVDMGTTNICNTIVMDCGSSLNDYPRGYQVVVSLDGTHWSSVVATGAGSAVMRVTFTAQPARFIRVTQTGSASANWWSIAEFNAYGVPGALPAAPGAVAAIPGDGLVTLTWNSSFGATGYNVQQSTTSGGPYAVTATNITSLAYTNYNLTNGTLYYLVVVPINSLGAGTPSVEVASRPYSTALTAISSASGSVTLSWATNLPLTLYSTTNLATPNSWMIVTNMPTSSNGQWILTLPTDTGSEGYFRLQ
ncbi:fibronectin type III domain-containing protein [Pedosphaera parvula]|uniref:Coagulation factor 5/8 type domain protein n=1 Tax=Pedosphaera parvula (strain Ellin514) TaxID=320771 RepID=B9XP13_PEDPL|nr:fibronectin type III domain-containing protein [Pedosphaera parvula]EEF58369.1 coagulation factor 5/8 type domain protein [Pedosphaera parvula Ellin514]